MHQISVTYMYIGHTQEEEVELYREGDKGSTHS